jgi:hypothetical protein
VKAKFRNPDQPLETWSRRGKLPRRLDAPLISGKLLDEFWVANWMECRAGARLIEPSPSIVGFPSSCPKFLLHAERDAAQN